MRKDKYLLTMDNQIHDLILVSLIEFKNKLIAEGRYTDAVDDALVEKYNATKENYEKVMANISSREDKRRVFENFIQSMKKQDIPLTEFDEGLWCSLVEFMTLYNKEEVGITLMNGTEIKVTK